MTARSLGRASEIRDRVIGSDPGLNRLRMAVSAAVAMTGAMAVEYGFGRATHAGAQGTMVAMMLGTVVAMMGSMALTGSAVWPKVRTAVFFPVAIGLGLVIGVAVSDSTLTMLVVFVAVMFAAVFVRRFGVAFFFYGFMTWMGFFFAAFLRPALADLPALVAAVAVGSVWVLMLSVTVLRTNSRRTLRRIQQAFGARARAVARTCADLLTAGDPGREARLRRRLHARQLRLAEAALMIEAWSAEPGALPEGWSGPALRRRLLDAQLAIDALALAADTLASTGGPTVSAAARIADHLARREYDGVRRTAAPLLRMALADTSAAKPAASRPGACGPAGREAPAPALGSTVRATGALGASAGGTGARATVRAAVADQTPAAGGPADGSRRVRDSGGAGTPGGGTHAPHMAAHQMAAAAMEYVALTRRADVPPVTDSDEDTYEPAVTLALGNLPGSASVAKDVTARGRSWNPLIRMTLTTRQSIQASVAGALAIVVGREISEARYYWAVIAAFIAFTGTATRSETFIKASNRVLGTLAGLFAGVGLAHLTAGHTLTVLLVIILSMACGFYLVQVSYACMIFFVTIMVSQLYSVLNEFSTGLLVLRLEETAAGAAIGILVALVILPTSTRDAVQSARGAFYSALADLLKAVADRLEPSAASTVDTSRTMDEAIRTTVTEESDAPETDLDALARALDRHLRGLALIAAPLTRPLVWGNDPRLVRHRLTLYAATARQARALALAPQRLTDSAAVTGSAAVCRSLAAAAEELGAQQNRSALPTAEVELRLAAAGTALMEVRPSHSAPPSALTLPLVHLRQLLHELATPQATPTPPTHRPSGPRPPVLVTPDGLSPRRP